VVAQHKPYVPTYCLGQIQVRYLASTRAWAVGQVPVREGCCHDDRLRPVIDLHTVQYTRPASLFHTPPANLFTSQPDPRSSYSAFVTKTFFNRST
jgi:hypothetical protein